MSDISDIIAEIDSNRLRRAKELSEIKVRMDEVGKKSSYGVHSKSLIVLSYAHWEGFYNECAISYVNALKLDGKKVGDTSWPLLIGVLRPGLQSLRDKNHSSDAEVEFVESLKNKLQTNFTEFDISVVLSKSNLNFHRLDRNFRVLGFDIQPFQEWRLKIDKELVGWRHSVAHGDDPDLSTLDLFHHIQFTQRLLLLLADNFQKGISEQCDSVDSQ
ncbi:hypothetical protein A3197_09875 [Candidatus Thiodiazotropha endoloripes]|nr:hypothetical protein A3197_09875 [Candidatus Thiodiazotropha endoloripes]